MNGSGTIRVRKRDGGLEPFQALKLAGMMWRGMQRTRGGFRDARDLAEAVEIHLLRIGQHHVTSEAVFDMALRVLRKIRMGDAARVLENHRLWRQARRTGLLLYHGPGQVTLWNKGWLCEHLVSAWNLSPPTVRVIAAAVEADLLALDEIMVTREEVLARMNEAVSQFGLAEAMPVHNAESGA